MPAWQHLGWVNGYQGASGEAGLESAGFQLLWVKGTQLI